MDSILNRPEREELLLLSLTLDTSGCDRQQFLSIMAKQPDEAVRREFHAVVAPLEFGGFAE